MAHFAELDLNNIVLRVIVLDNSVLENLQDNQIEQAGIEFLHNLFGANTIWKQTSYNTRGGIYYDPVTNEPALDQSKAFRKNYAGIGYSYNLNKDAFVNSKPLVDQSVEQYVSFNEFSCLWDYSPTTINVEIGVNRV